jgi:Ser/Thr protein kinase RdoA (MazF antagonist)
MTSFQPPRERPPLVCPICGRVVSRMAVTAAGELISCDTCARERGISADIIDLNQWESVEDVREALAGFGVTDYVAVKTPQSQTQEPRAHVWEVWSGDRRLVLKRYHAWLEDSAIRYEHSILQRLAQRQMPVASPLPAPSGERVLRSSSARWALYPALDGIQATQQEWMWRVPRAAEALAALHIALQGFTPDGAPHREWEAWSLERVDAMMAQWPAVPGAPPALVLDARDRLAARYFTPTYQGLAHTIVHGEFSIANVLWRGDQVVGILDFEKAHSDTVLFDFMCGVGTRHPPLVRAVVATYTRTRPLSPEERNLLPEALLLGALIGLDVQLMVYQNMDEAARRAQDVFFLMRDAEALRRAVALK